MLIAISCTKNDIHARFDRRFGRCAWFFLWNTRSHIGCFMENVANKDNTDAGFHAAKLLSEENVKRVFSGDFGESAAEALQEYSIEAFLLRDDGLTLSDILKLRTINHTIDNLER